MEERREAQLDAMNDVIAEKVSKYVSKNLEEIVADHEDEIRKILKKKGRRIATGQKADTQPKEGLGVEQDKDLVQFENLPKCELENHYERCPSGRRICKFYDAPCGVENPAECVVLQKVNKDMALAKVRAINIAQAEQHRTKKRRVKDEL